MITIEKPPIPAEEIIILEPNVVITGNSAEGTRKAEIIFPVKNSEGNFLTPLSKVYTGEDFNAFYEAYTDDKSMIEKVFSDLNMEVDTSLIPENLENI